MFGSSPLTHGVQTRPAARVNLTIVGSNRDQRDCARLPGLVERPRTAVMACLSPCKSGNETLLRKAMLAARESRGELYAVYVAQRGGIRQAEARSFINDLILAGHLGAKIVWLESHDAAGAFLKFARKAGVGRILVRRSEPVRQFRPFHHSVYGDLLRRGEGFRIDVVGFERRD